MEFATMDENEEQRFLRSEHEREMYEFIEAICPPLASQAHLLGERFLVILEQECAKVMANQRG